MKSIPTAVNANNKNYFLEIVRSLSAIYVFVYHVQQKFTFIEPFKLLFSFGQEAVMIFFILSGFVIYYSVENKKEISIRDYIKARALRIYPLFFIACILTYICQLIYANELIAFPVIPFVENVFMLQDFSTGKPGVWVNAFMGNLPLWSLSYEWWFYMLFIPVFFYVSKNMHAALVGFISIGSTMIYLYFPNQVALWLMYFIIWWIGAEISKKYITSDHSDKSIITLFGCMGFILIALMIFAYTSFYKKNIPLAFGLFPVLFIRHFFIASFFSILLWKIDVRRIVISPSNILVKFAPYTYGIYIFHYPLLVLFFKKGWLQNTIWGMPVLILLIFLLAYVSENLIQKNLVRWFHKK